MSDECKVKNNGYQPTGKFGYQPQASSDTQVIPPPPTTDSTLTPPDKNS